MYNPFQPIEHIRADVLTTAACALPQERV